MTGCFYVEEDVQLTTIPITPSEAGKREGELMPKRPNFSLDAYDAATLEGATYQWWWDSGFFKPSGATSAKAYAIVMPPPNVTGVLHLGHALDNSIQDALIRFRRMQGYDVLWMPGTDHAGIATQTRVEAQIKATQGLTRHELGREAFVERVWAWKEEYAEVIRSQIRRLGASCDWSRERFTMDPGLSAAVREVFVTLYERGLIYRGEYIINWCPRCTTALSDIEVEHEETEGTLYHIRYPFADGDGYLTVATTRPETMLGDTAVAVHPDDERYAAFVGRRLRLPLTEREIPLIADAYVDSAFGTGAVKITPAHDPNDFEVGRRHGLPAINIMTKDGALADTAGEFAGMERFAARAAIVARLEAEGLLTRERHVHAVGHCERCSTVVEPWLSTQWFVRMKPLSEPAQAVVDNGTVRFVPERFTKIYGHWLESIRDWCISRQLWWGHRIPAWHCADCAGVTVAREQPAACSHCGQSRLHQDDDVLDTWFSSALWPFSTMGWPEQTTDLQRYFPTDVLVTGPDIIGFWVTRMIFTSLEFTGRQPFSDVLIHGLVRDDQGRKFSKSLNNGIDPMDVIDKFSADALRFMLLTGAAMGQDMRFYEERVEAAQALVTKLWNAARFVAANAEGQAPRLIPVGERTLAERYLLHRLDETVATVTQQLEAYQFPEAGKSVYEFFWNDVCDWYIELSKVALYSEDENEKIPVRQTLLYVLDQALRLLHPFMPFVTESIWQSLFASGPTIMRSSWPTVQGLQDREAVSSMLCVMDAIRTVRNLRHELSVAPSRKIDLIVRPDAGMLALFASQRAVLTRLCNCQSLLIAVDAPVPVERVGGVVTGAELFLSLVGLVDLDAERQRLQKECDDLDYEVQRLEGKLGNEAFVNKAPATVVELERQKLLGYVEKRAKVLAQLGNLGTSGMVGE